MRDTVSAICLATDTQSNKVKVPDNVHKKWDAMMDEYNPIMARIDGMRQTGSTSFKSRSGKVVDLNELISTLSSVLYKLGWAGRSLEYLLEFQEKHGGSLEDAEQSLTEAIPDVLFFKADVFFSFAYSALDIAAEAINMLIETDLDDAQVYFRRVIDILTKSTYANDMFRMLQKESNEGWIHELRQYRIVVTHRQGISTQSSFSYTTRDHSVEINLYMIPDDPLKRPLAYEDKRELAPYCLDVIEKEIPIIEGLFKFMGTLI